jgi:hypothetical protein
VAFRVTVSEGIRPAPDESIATGMASNTLEEKTMPEPTDKLKVVDPIKHDLENASMSRPEWALDHHSPGKSNDSGTKPIPKSFIDAVLEIIAQSIEKVLAEVMARCVAEGVDQKIRPLSQEIALLRIAIEHDWDSSGRRRRGISSEDDENPS